MSTQNELTTIGIICNLKKKKKRVLNSPFPASPVCGSECFSSSTAVNWIHLACGHLKVSPWTLDTFHYQIVNGR